MSIIETNLTGINQTIATKADKTTLNDYVTLAGEETISGNKNFNIA